MSVACVTATTSASATALSAATMSLPDFLLPPPTYSLSAAAPSYSSEPGPSEQRLAITSRKSSRQGSLGTLRKSHSGIVIALRDQDATADAPTYGRGGYIAGDVELASNQSILSVTATIEGRLELSIAELSESEGPFLSISQTLWKADGASSTCPSLLPFELVLPETYQDRVDDRTRPLPPSFDPFSDGLTMQSMSARVEYRIVIRVTKAKLGKMLWKPSKSLTVHMDYAPRSRPHQPILASPFPFLTGTLKSLPEEWTQICATMSSKTPSLLSDIDCHLFIPAVQIYGIADEIPFSLQLRAPAASLQALLLPAAPTASSLALRRAHTASSAKPVEPTLRVFIRRQVVVNARGQRLARSYTIGEGTLRPVPPGSAPVNVGVAPEDAAVDYEGEIRCEPDVTVGGFGTARLTVSDFLMLSIVPAGASVDSFAEVTKAYPIRIVTESYRTSV